MELQMKTITVIVLVVVLLAAIVIFFASALGTTSDVEAKNIFAQGCIKYCREISAENNVIDTAIKTAESLEGSEFIRACRQLHDIKYNWQCWNRNCCEFSVYEKL